MQRIATYRKCIVTALYGALMAFFLTLPAFAEDKAPAQQIEEWLSELADPDNAQWEQAQRALELEWSRSGSTAMDLLLRRGEDAMAAGDYTSAIEHLTALTEQAPDFAEGWNARATAYYLSGLYGPSVVDIEHVLALNPHHFGAMSGLGMILQETGKLERARVVFKASLSINPHQDGIRDALEQLEKELGGVDL
jgi:tetratricopeptide (TPR) repeat protein